MIQDRIGLRNDPRGGLLISSQPFRADEPALRVDLLQLLLRFPDLFRQFLRVLVLILFQLCQLCLHFFQILIFAVDPFHIEGIPFRLALAGKEIRLFRVPPALCQSLQIKQRLRQMRGIGIDERDRHFRRRCGLPLVKAQQQRHRAVPVIGQAQVRAVAEQLQ